MELGGVFGDITILMVANWDQAPPLGSTAGTSLSQNNPPGEYRWDSAVQNNPPREDRWDTAVQKQSPKGAPKQSHWRTNGKTIPKNYPRAER